MDRLKMGEQQYIQQHLANERTFLAWIRTAIAVIGLGFLAAGVVFRTAPDHHAGHWVAAIVGVGSVCFGGIVVLLATKAYLTKQRSISEGLFCSPRLDIWILALGLVVIEVFLLALVIILLLW